MEASHPRGYLSGFINSYVLKAALPAIPLQSTYQRGIYPSAPTSLLPNVDSRLHF